MRRRQLAVDALHGAPVLAMPDDAIAMRIIHHVT
jgi:hypothetical protein